MTKKEFYSLRYGLVGEPTNSPTALEEEEITLPLNENIFVVAFTSEPFKKRVLEGIERLKKLRAESGFSIVSDGKRIVYSPVALGTSSSEDNISLFQMTGGSIRTGFGLNNISVFPGKGFSPLGSFHFHPICMSFSTHDIEEYDRLVGESLGLNSRLNFFEGVFIPTWENKDLYSLKLFMFQGPPTGTYHQALDFDSANLKAQRNALTKSGMKVIAVDIFHGRRGGLDLAPLARNIVKTIKG